MAVVPSSHRSPQNQQTTREDENIVHCEAKQTKQIESVITEQSYTFTLTEIQPKEESEDPPNRSHQGLYTAKQQTH
jgi:hypothetical protein